MDRLDQAAALAAFARRDRAFDGRFVVGVTSTGIYCRPSCAARRPKPENTVLLANGEAARERGLRPCRRCRPDDVARDRVAVERALRLIDDREERMTLAELAAKVGYSPAHFQRVFSRQVGVSPAVWARGRRAEAAERALQSAETVTEAIGDAGFGSAAAFYESAADRLGMTPSAWRRGGEGVAIRWTVVATSLGRLLVAATERGLCRVAFDTGEAELRAHFAMAEIVRDDAGLGALAKSVVAAVERPGEAHNLRPDVAGTAFQHAVWRELARIAPGETISYAALAVRAGRPGAARAAGSACGANPLAVVVPCHRARRGDGSPGGYAWGLERKAELLRREREG